jgi:hypothetical protein
MNRFTLVIVAVLVSGVTLDRTEAQDSKPVANVDSFETAFAKLAKQIDESAKEKPTVVAWVIDESGSMDAVRKRLAESVAKLRANSEKGTTVSWTVSGFSEQLHVLAPRPLTDMAAVSRAVRKVANDPSGKENVFTAVHQTTQQLKKLTANGDKKGIIVVVTNEQGDDRQGLENAIAVCKRSGIRVFCLGHAAPFGTEKSFVRIKFEDGFVQETPVDSGAETAILTVLKMPNLGGAPIEPGRLSSGFGPWALSRLCDATGGEYLIALDETKIRFSADVMARYRPDYQPTREMERDFKRSVSRMAVVQAAMASRQHKKVDPALTFRAETANILRVALTESQRPCAVNEYQCHQILQLLEAGEKGREEMTDPRWQASYDLAVGQTQAALARSVGLNVRIAQMKVAAPKIDGPNFNTWEIYAVKENQKSTALEKKLAAKAKDFLDRVVKEHKGTPFAHIAQQELERGFGWEWRQIHVEYKTPANQIKPRDTFPITEPKSEKTIKVRRRPRIIPGKF